MRWVVQVFEHFQLAFLFDIMSNLQDACLKFGVIDKFSTLRNLGYDQSFFIQSPALLIHRQSQIDMQTIMIMKQHLCEENDDRFTYHDIHRKRPLTNRIPTPSLQIIRHPEQTILHPPPPQSTLVHPPPQSTLIHPPQPPILMNQKYGYASAIVQIPPSYSTPSNLFPSSFFYSEFCSITFFYPEFCSIPFFYAEFCSIYKIEKNY